MSNHPWGINRIQAIDESYLLKNNINMDGIDDETLNEIYSSTKKASKDFIKIGSIPPLIKNNEHLQTKYHDIKDNLSLNKHGYCNGCPSYIIEVNPTPNGCQLNCLYCLAVANKSIQTEVSMYNDYHILLKKYLHENRIKNVINKGILYYWSPVTDAFSPQMISSGTAYRILDVFIHHIKTEEKRLKTYCPDTILINTKAGIQDLIERNSNGVSLLDLIKKIPNNIQIQGSCNYYGGNDILMEAMEPGARAIKDRYEFLKVLQKNNILASTMLVQPIIPIDQLIPNYSYFKELHDYVGVDRVYIDLLTSNIKSLGVIFQIIGWFYPDGEKELWVNYINSRKNAPKKSGDRFSAPISMQENIYTDILKYSKDAGISDISYCWFTQDSIKSIPFHDFNDYSKVGCMGYISPDPKEIEIARYKQRHSS